MTLVLFESALDHLTRIYRLISMPRGNALLVGVGGSGKQSLTKLATFAAGYTLFELTLTRGYGETEHQVSDQLDLRYHTWILCTILAQCNNVDRGTTHHKTVLYVGVAIAST